MTDLPRVDIEQVDLPGTDGVISSMVLHACTSKNFSQRITIARRLTSTGRRNGHQRHHDIQLTRAQVLELIDHLIDRVDLMTDDIPGADRARL